jgi:hypothetical protein
MSYGYDGSLAVNLSAAVAHHKDAGASLSAAVDCDPDSDEHKSWIRSAHAHQKMSADFIERYRGEADIDDPHDVNEGDPEGGKPTTQEQEEEKQRRRWRRLGELAAGAGV